MSYFNGPDSGYGWAAGHFLVDDETCLRETTTLSAEHSQAEQRGDRLVVPAGAIVPANDGTAIGILYEDIDVTNGDMPASIVVQGTVYTDRLPEAPTEDETEGGVTTEGAITALKGITFVDEPTITRPYTTDAE